jgi:hypothetical protein
MKTETPQDFNEIVKLLIWAYKQGYSHAAEVVKGTVPKEEALEKMFKDAMSPKADETV